MSRPRHAVELDSTGNVQAGAVWLADGHEAHILAWLPTDADSQAQLRVLNHIACAAAEKGAQRMDFPLCDAPYDLSRLRRFSIAAEMSDEKPLMPSGHNSPEYPSCRTETRGNAAQAIGIDGTDYECLRGAAALRPAVILGSRRMTHREVSDRGLVPLTSSLARLAFGRWRADASPTAITSARTVDLPGRPGPVPIRVRARPDAVRAGRWGGGGLSAQSAFGARNAGQGPGSA